MIKPPGKLVEIDGGDPSRSGWRPGRTLGLRDVIVKRGSTIVLDGVTLEFAPGFRYVIVGPSGSGKSTLLRLLNRLEDPISGRVTIGDEDLLSLPVRLVRSAIGLVFQAPRPLPGTVSENLAYPFLVRGLPPPPESSMASQIGEVGLDPSWLKRDAEALSGGERQRLALAVALGTNPECLAMDEPTSALDPASARQIADALSNRAAETGLRTIAVTHHRGHAPLLGDRVVVLDRGKVVAEGAVAEVLGRELEATR